MESVPDHIFGYTILNDVTARERQVRYKTDGTMFYEAGSSKNFDNSTPIGPCIVTTDEIRIRRTCSCAPSSMTTAPEQQHP